MFIALTLFAAAPVTDWRPMQAAAEKYGYCGFMESAPYLKTSMKTEAIVQLAMEQCLTEARFLESETRRVFEPFSNSKADLDQTVNEYVVKQRDLLRNMLTKELNKRR